MLVQPSALSWNDASSKVSYLQNHQAYSFVISSHVTFLPEKTIFLKCKARTGAPWSYHGCLQPCSACTLQNSFVLGLSGKRNKQIWTECNKGTYFIHLIYTFSQRLRAGHYRKHDPSNKLLKLNINMVTRYFQNSPTILRLPVFTLRIVWAVKVKLC